MFGLIKQVDDQFTLSADGNPYTTLGYADGPGGLNGSRPNITSEDTAHKDYLQQATVLLDYESHASEDVGKNVDEFWFQSAAVGLSRIEVNGVTNTHRGHDCSRDRRLFPF